jgi:predicted O-methyltransferase YrrM
MDATYARSNNSAHYKAGERHLQRLRGGAITSWDIEGWCDFRDLYTAFAKKLQDGDVFVEVGAWKGQSIIHLAQRLQDQEKTVKIYAVDTFSGDSDTGFADVFKQFDANVQAAGCGRNIIAVALPSIMGATGFDDASLAGVFIDAAHDYRSVSADLKAWLSKVKKGGIFAGHDIDCPDVQRALDDAGIQYVTVGRCWVMIQTEQP